MIKLTKQKIVKGNKLIAEFIGLLYRSERYFTGWYKTSNFETGTRVCDNEGLKYHYSMDWLMPVLTKIQKLILANDNEICIELYENSPQELCTFVSIGEIQTSHPDTVTAIWLAVVCYIEKTNKIKRHD